MQGCNKTGREAHTQQGKYLLKVQRQVRRASPAIQNSISKQQKVGEMKSQAEVRL